MGGVKGLRVVLARFCPPSTVPATDGLHTQSAAGFVLVDADVIAVETDGREVWWPPRLMPESSLLGRTV